MNEVEVGRLQTELLLKLLFNDGTLQQFLGGKTQGQSEERRRTNCIHSATPVLKLY